MGRRFWILSALLFVAATLRAQTATITFTLDFPNSQPEHYFIRVQSDGSAHYESSGRISADSDDTDSFAFDFTVGPETRGKIFELAAKSDYFKKDIASHQKGMAFTGQKTLTYKDALREGQSSYNYSAKSSVEDLTTLMQNLSATLEFGHRLQYDHRYQKLALDQELKRMEEMSRDKDLIEIAAIQPILDQIIADQSVINVTRARAQRLLERATAR